MLDAGYWIHPPPDPFYEGGCQGCTFPDLGVVGPDIRVLHDAQQDDLLGDDDPSFLMLTPLLFF
jgi:hypothetical protein